MEDETKYSDDLASFVNDEFRRRQSDRLPFELQWRLNMEFIKGNQYLTVNSHLRKIDEVPKLYWYQEREVFNQIATIIETRIAQLSRQRPMMKVRPASGDETDIQSAKLSNAILESKWHDESMDNKQDDLVTWMEHTGTGIIKNTWDADKGAMVGQAQTNEEIDLGEGFTDEQETFIDVYEGDVDTEIISPFEFYPDSNFRNNMDEVRSCIHAKAFHVKDILEMYGVQVDAEQIDSFTMQSGGSLSGLGYKNGSFTTKTETIKDHAIVKEYYERPSDKFPEGRFIVIAGDDVLYSGDLPYKNGQDGKRELPFIRVPCLPIPNQFWGQSVAERCIPIQRRYNALRNRKAEYLNLVTIGQWYEPIGSLDDDEDDELNNAPGNRIRYHQGAGRPEPVDFPSLPSSFENEQQSLLGEFTAVSGVSELSRFSEAPSGVKSGVALSIANEQDDTRLSMSASRIGEGIRVTGQHWIRLFKQFAEEPRLVKLSDDIGDVVSWTASDLESDDIIIENISALSETPAQRRQMVLDLIGTGMFNREENNPFSKEGVRKILELIEMGHWETGVNDMLEMNKDKADRENRFLQQGQQPQVRSYDDHAVHIEQHNRFRLRPEYEEILMSPYGQMIDFAFEQHVNMHRQAIAQQQFQVQQQQMMMQGPQRPPQ